VIDNSNKLLSLPQHVMRAVSGVHGNREDNSQLGLSFRHTVPCRALSVIECPTNINVKRAGRLTAQASLQSKSSASRQQQPDPSQCVRTSRGFRRLHLLHYNSKFTNLHLSNPHFTLHLILRVFLLVNTLSVICNRSTTQCSVLFLLFLWHDQKLTSCVTLERCIAQAA
jgi:hypothetical protein